MKNFVCRALLVTGLCAGYASATALTVVNPGFDADAVGEGVSTCNGGGGFTGWNSTGGFCGTGLLNPDSTQFPGGIAPSQNNVAYHNGNVAFWQALTDTYQPGFVYTFGIQIGHRLDVSYGGYIIELRAGNSSGTLLASSTNQVTPGAGQFLPTSVSYTAFTGGPGIGQNIAIVFRGIGVQTQFDNVTVDASPTPEPGTFACIGLAALAGGMVRRRRKASR